MMLLGWVLFAFVIGFFAGGLCVAAHVRREIEEKLRLAKLEQVRGLRP